MRCSYKTYSTALDGLDCEGSGVADGSRLGLVVREERLLLWLEGHSAILIVLEIDLSAGRCH